MVKPKTPLNTIAKGRPKQQALSTASTDDWIAAGGRVEVLPAHTVERTTLPARYSVRGKGSQG